MTSTKSYLSIALAVFLLFSGCKEKTVNLIQYVNPLIGTGPSTGPNAVKHNQGSEAWGQDIPAVSTPFGMTQWTPQTRETENKCVSPYYYGGTNIHGFRGTHWLGGSCVQDYGSFTIMPITGYLKTMPSERSSNYKHETEISTPAYYSSFLEKYMILAEMTGTARSGFFKFSYLREEKASILIMPNSDEGQGYIKIDPGKREIYGYNPIHRIYQGWGQPAGFNGYFVVRFDRPLDNFGCYFQMEDYKQQTEISGKPEIGAYATFTTQINDIILAKVGTSFTSIEEARANLDAEIPHWDFEKTKAETEEIWNKSLSTIQLKGGKAEDYEKFYTAMYHSMLYPRTFSDVDGSYPSFDGNKSIQKIEAGHVYYDDFSLWDTHRAQLPLVSLIAPDKYEDMMKSLVLKAEQGGWLPIFPLWNSYTSAMVGDHANTALGDAYLKGFDINIDKAYPYMRKNAFEISEGEDYKNGKGRRALKSYLEYGYIPLEDSVKEAFHKNEQTSRTLEYSMVDAVLSKVAEKYGKTEDAQTLAKRGKNYQLVFDDETKSMNGRHIDGTWASGYNPNARASYLTEGTPMQHLWYVPQDIPGLFDLIGDKNQVREKLDELFDSGEYWHSNEPCHHIPYLYNYLGDYVKTQKIVKNILATEYTNYDGGIPGNDDSGQMSAWYIFSAMGFYPVSPGSGEYQVSSPIFSEVELNLNPKYYPGGKFRISINNEDTYKTFNHVELNGKEIPFVLKHEDIRRGGELKFSNSVK
ncbi:MAG: GH92 family glycosyl hydrolase [Prolixibacteraceae bacterium]|jgi:predicted alpha-1,2-mannosidase